MKLSSVAVASVVRLLTSVIASFCLQLTSSKRFARKRAQLSARYGADNYDDKSNTSCRNSEKSRSHCAVMSGPAVEAGVGAGPSKSDELAAVKQKDLKQAEASTATALSAPLAAVAAGLDGASPPGGAAAIAQTLASGQASSSNGHGHTVVPAYPYNVSMAPFIPGHSSARTDGYFEQHVPDDSNVQTRLPSICVDYLSHDWEEDDVWTSWKAMTKHKTEIANGVRLENASWRTWAKQRGKLKTISPETLNW